MLNRMAPRLLLLATLVVATPFLLACPVSAVTLDQSFTGPTDAVLAILGGQYIGQTYTANITGTLAGVNLDIAFCGGVTCSPASDTTFPMQVAIYDIVDGLPTTVLGSTTLPAGQPAPLSLLITFPEVISEIAGKQHAIVVNFPGSTLGPCCPFPNNGLWPVSTMNSYTAGDLVFSNDGVSWTPIFGPGGTRIFADVHFQTYINPEREPEPATLLLFSSGLVVFGGVAWRHHRRK